MSWVAVFTPTIFKVLHTWAAELDLMVHGSTLTYHISLNIFIMRHNYCIAISMVFVAKYASSLVCFISLCSAFALGTIYCWSSCWRMQIPWQTLSHRSRSFYELFSSRRQALLSGRIARPFTSWNFLEICRNKIRLFVREWIISLSLSKGTTPTQPISSIILILEEICSGTHFSLVHFLETFYLWEVSQHISV